MYPDQFRYSYIFSDARYAFRTQDFSGETGASLLKCEPFQQIHECDALIFLKQVHGTNGVAIGSRDEAKRFTVFSTHADYAMTHVPRVALGVITADCVPLLFYDSRNRVVAAAHGGWRGTVAGIGGIVIDHMKREYGTHPADLEVRIGPSAGPCCYEVGDEVLVHVRRYSWGHQVISGRIFDLPGFHHRYLSECGVLQGKIQMEDHCCTICNKAYCSVRRQSGTLDRQFSLVMLSR
ncbi:laccase domain-containing protein [Candidatus Babeliales bacterium]|nr:laccase domain-containing protein [Candidatus Babeliales bacterium]